MSGQLLFEDLKSLLHCYLNVRFIVSVSLVKASILIKGVFIVGITFSNPQTSIVIFCLAFAVKIPATLTKALVGARDTDGSSITLFV